MKRLMEKLQKAFAIHIVGKRLNNGKWKCFDYYGIKERLSFTFDIIYDLSLITALILLIADFLCRC